MTRPQLYGVPALRGLVAVLPAHAHTVFYRDEIGNISTSNLRYGKKRVSDSACTLSFREPDNDRDVPVCPCAHRLLSR